MARYAFFDEQRTQVLLANNITAKYSGNNFYCPTVFCSAILRPVMRDGTYSNYFRALSNHPHDSKCFHQSNIDHSSADYDEKLFDIDSFIDAASQETVSASRTADYSKNTVNNDIEKKLSISTIKQVREEFKSRDPGNIQSLYNGKIIGYMFLAHETKHFYNKIDDKQALFGSKIVEIDLSKDFFFKEYSNYFQCTVELSNRSVALRLLCKKKSKLATKALFESLKTQILGKKTGNQYQQSDNKHIVANFLIACGVIRLSQFPDDNGNKYYYMYISSKKQFYGTMF